MSSTQSFNTVHQAQATAEDDEEQVPSEDEANERAGLEHVGTTSTQHQEFCRAPGGRGVRQLSGVGLCGLPKRGIAKGRKWRNLEDFHRFSRLIMVETC